VKTNACHWRVILGALFFWGLAGGGVLLPSLMAGADPGGAAFYDGSCPTPRWVICAAAVKGRDEARSRAQKLNSQGYSSGYLWVPDYGSLSGAQTYLVFIGPYALNEKAQAQAALADYKKINKSAYGIKVDTKGPRETLNEGKSSREAGNDEEMPDGERQFSDGYCVTPTWVIAAGAVKSRSEAKARAEKLFDQGYQAGYLWIPDYGTLSGAQMYMVYIGPFDLANKAEAKRVLEQYKQVNKSAYGIKVAESGPRETF
jgi:cell division septation protein DedD